MKESFKNIENHINRSEKILILSHKKPDADTLGSAIALKIWLSGLNKKVTLACIDEPDLAFSFLPYIHEFEDCFNLNDYDLVVYVDVGASYMTSFHNKYDNLLNFSPSICIDHHPSNDNFCNFNIIDLDSASTTIILYKMFKFLAFYVLKMLFSHKIIGPCNLCKKTTPLQRSPLTGSYQIGIKI